MWGRLHLSFCLMICLVSLSETHFLNGQSQGSLNLVQTFDTGDSPSGIAYSPFSPTLSAPDVPSGLYLSYIKNSDKESAFFTINDVELENGNLSPNLINSLSSIIFPGKIITYSPLLPNSTFAYVASSNIGTTPTSGGINFFAVNLTSGTFGIAGPPPILPGATAVAFSSDDVLSSSSKQLFAAIASSSNLTFYNVNTDYNNLQSSKFTILQSFELPTGYTNPSVAFSPLISSDSAAPFYAAISLAPESGSSNQSLVQVYQFNNVSGIYQAPILVQSFNPPAISPGSIAFSPTPSTDGGGRYAAITDSNSEGTDGLYLYQVDSSSTPLQLIAQGKTGSNPVGVAFSYVNPTNLFVAVANSGSNDVSVFNVNDTTGALTQVSNNPFPAGTTPLYLAYSPWINIDDQNFLYLAVSNSGSNDISVYSVNLVGSVTNQSGAQLAVTNGPTLEVTSGPTMGVTNGPSLEVTGNSRAKKLPKINYVNRLTWNPPEFGSSSIVAYQIFERTKHRKKRLLGEVLSTSPLIFKQPHQKPCKKYEYFIVAVDESGEVSAPVSVKIKGKKFVKPEMTHHKRKKIVFKTMPCSELPCAGFRD